MTTTQPSDLKQSRIVIVDDDVPYLIRCARVFWKEGYQQCTPVAVFPYAVGSRKPAFALNEEEIAVELKLISENFQGTIEREFSSMTEQQQKEIVKGITPTNLTLLTRTYELLQPQLIILDTEMGEIRAFDSVKYLKEKIQGIKIIGSSRDPAYRSRWKQEGADAFFKKTVYAMKTLPTLVDAVLQDLPEARATLEGKTGGW